MPAVTLVWLDLSEYWRSWFQTDSVLASSSAKDPEQLAAALERRSASLAWDALHDTEATALARPNRDVIARHRRLEAAASLLRQRHPIIKTVFIVRKGTAEFPRLAKSHRQTRAQYLAEHAGRQAQKLSALLALADRQQRDGNCYKALAALARAESIATAAPVKALVLQSKAACLVRLGLRGEAQSAYTTLLQRYGDEYAPDGTPYGIGAVLARGTNDDSGLVSTYREFVNGRWELTADQVSELDAAFHSRLGDAAPREETEYLYEADSARALQQALRRGAATKRESASQQIAAQPGLFGLAFSGRQDYQSYYTPITLENGEKVLLGLIADLDFLQQKVCPELGIGGAYELAYTRNAIASAASTPFKTAYPFWQLRPATVAAKQTAAHLRNLIALCSEVLATILCLGVFGLHRHVLRERETIQMRSDFVSGVSHELKTPITVIRLYSETLMQLPTLHPDGREYCEIISHEAQRLNRLVEGVLSVAAIERGVQTYSFSDCEIGGLTSQILAPVRSYYQYKGYTLWLDVEADLPMVKVDVESYSSALLNLVDNAVKYSNPSNVVRVRVYPGDESVVVSVEDHGNGIAPDAIERIFDPFFRADNAAAHGGCGLGLHLVRQVMKAHGGSVQVTSKPGSGSRFALVFPPAARPVLSSGHTGSRRVSAVQARKHEAA